MISVTLAWRALKSGVSSGTGHAARRGAILVLCGSFPAPGCAYGRHAPSCTDGWGPGHLYTRESGMPTGPKRPTPPQEHQAYGLTILHPNHPEVRRLQHDAARPALHGHKVWPTSFVLIDYLHQRGVPPQACVLEISCGWGLVGIACAKTSYAPCSRAGSSV